MRQRLSVVCTCIILGFGHTALVQGGAVSELNGEVGALFGEAEGSGIESKDKTYALQANVPLTPLVGLNLFVSSGESRIKTTPNYTAESDVWAVAPFVRDPELGLIGIRVGRTRTDRDDGTPRNQSDDYTILGAAYSPVATLSLSYTKNNAKEGSNPDTTVGRVDLVWYFHPNLLMDVAAGFKDDKHGYGVGVEHQPAGDASNFSYGVNWWNNSHTDEKSVYVVANYRFARQKSLVKRYHEDLFSHR